MCKALKQIVSEIEKCYRHKIFELFKDTYNSFKVLFVILQPYFPLTPLRKHLKT